MTDAVAERPGVRHLLALARRPRPAGSPSERDARDYAARALLALGFDVREERFGYSAFPGRFATPVGGTLLALSLVATSGMALAGARAALVVGALGLGTAFTTLYARWMLRYGVLDFPWLRTEGINLVATRARVPKVWLVAHLDSKSQPVPSSARVGGIALLALSLVLAICGALLTLAGVPSRTLWWGALATAVVGAVPVIASVVGARSDGAVDNASGVAAVLAAAALVGREVAIGVLLPTAEELGLAGARSWARMHPAGIALNCDGVDDEGELVIMFNRRMPAEMVAALRSASRRDIDVRRMPLGLLTDSTALADAGWTTVTVSHGSLATLRRVHTPNDSLARMRGTSIDDVSVILARAAEALAS